MLTMCFALSHVQTFMLVLAIVLSAGEKNASQVFAVSAWNRPATSCPFNTSATGDAARELHAKPTARVSCTIPCNFADLGFLTGGLLLLRLADGLR